jgi:hypothetical protein
MSTTTQMANSLLKLYFQAVDIANIADDTLTTPATKIYLSFHTASPGIAGNQTTNECDYTGHTRVELNRNDTDWTVTNNECKPAAAVNGGPCTGGTNTATHWGIGRSASGAGTLDFFGELSAPISISNGITPQLTTNTVIRIKGA